MTKVKATKPPKAEEPGWMIVPYVYAAGLAIFAVLQLIGFGGFDFAGINFETQGTATSIIILSAVSIFSIPFLLRLTLSPLARACSAVLSLALPLLMLGNAVFVRNQETAMITSAELIIGAILGILAIASFNILSGDRVLVFKKHSK